MNKILVTGADGFIGSHLVEELVKQGYNVKAFVYYNSFNSWGWIDTLSEEIKNQIGIFSGDIRDPNGVRIAMEGWRKIQFTPISEISIQNAGIGGNQF